MGQINRLDQQTTNRIAAGEVIERLASVVKELVENSIDAGAKNIKVALIDSGLQEILVTDDGSGMDYADAKMAIEPHATSKIKSSDDLFTIHTLGFRGEALPSIVSVSQFKLKTSIDGQKGLMYTLKGGHFVSEAMVATPKGTEISVRNLFFNTPARLQSLQSANVELSYTTDYITKTAMARPDIAFTLLNNERVIFQSYGNSDVLEVILAAYGTDVARDMIDVFNDNGAYRISGYVSKNQASRSSKSHIAIAVNGRIVRNSNIVQAVCNAYDGFLVGGRYPIAFINIEVDYSLVDVNVHPAKLEVRFSSEQDLIQLIISTIQQRLKQAVLIPNITLPTTPEEKTTSMFGESIPPMVVLSSDEDKTTIAEDSAIGEEEREQEMEEDEESTGEEEDDEPSEEESLDEVAEKLGFDEEEPTEAATPLQEKELETPIEFVQQEYQLTENKENYRSTNRLPKMHYIGQLFGTYILAQAEDEFYLIDQHAANERIQYERILKALQQEKVLTYDLLVPLKIDFSVAEALLIHEHLQTFEDLSIALEDFGSGSFTIRSIPTWIPQGREKEFVEGIAMGVVHHHQREKWQFIDEVAKELACKKSIKANEYHNILEIEYLLNDLSNANNPYTCPHGRPVVVKFSKSEIERWFKRVL